MRPFLLLAGTLLAGGCTAGRAQEAPPPPTDDAAPARKATAPAQGEAPGRLRPPPLACDRNDLTSWRGRVTGYRRDAQETWLQISTDEDTVEATTLRHPDAADARAFYRIEGKDFSAADFARIESAPGHLREGMRATAWICLDGMTPPIIDWQPPPV